MNLTIKHAFGFVVVAAALCATAGQASADEIYKGAVNLPFETHWGAAVLQPGSYTISIQPALSGAFIRIRGASGEQEVLAGAFDTEPISRHGSLTIVNVGGTNVVKRFDAGVIGKSFDFHVPKGKRTEIGRVGADQETTVSVFGTH
jgi:hypothetical protein